MPDSIGDPRRQHPIPLRLRNCNIFKSQGGSFGYRGPGYEKMRARVLYLAGYRSTATGLPQGAAQLEVDHISPYRIGGLTPHTNELTNLRVLDGTNNAFLDAAQGFQERKIRRRMRSL